jgi:anti-sigma regulatory factor (Ser/Thr protein kinase)
VPVSREYFLNYLGELMVPEEELANWKLAYTELVNNAIIHGAKSDPKARIGICWEFYAGQVKLTVTDPGSGPPPGSELNPALPDDPTQQNGRGYFIISQCVDHLSAWRGADGYRVELVKASEAPCSIPPASLEMQSVLAELAAWPPFTA